MQNMKHVQSGIEVFELNLVNSYSEPYFFKLSSSLSLFGFFTKKYVAIGGRAIKAIKWRMLIA